jgi:hypothetical protein
MSLAGVNIARAVALVEDSCCFRYAANAIEAPLASRHRAVRRFQKTDWKRATTYRDDRFLNNNGVPLFLPVSVVTVFFLTLTMNKNHVRLVFTKFYILLDDKIKNAETASLVKHPLSGALSCTFCTGGIFLIWGKRRFVRRTVKTALASARLAHSYPYFLSESLGDELSCFGGWNMNEVLIMDLSTLAYYTKNTNTKRGLFVVEDVCISI